MALLSFSVLMRFDILTIFPRMFDLYLGESILKRAVAKGVIDARVYDLRDFTDDAHRTVDDVPYGGGPGMVIKIEPIARAVASISKSQKPKTRIILFSAKGKQFDSKMARRLAKYDQLILICGRYEGVDERVAQYVADEEISIGPYVLTGGELAALVLLDAVVRHIPGVLGKKESVEERRYGIGVPVYTRPEVFIWNGRVRRVPKVLLSGDHKKIYEWRKEKVKSRAYAPLKS